MAMTKENGSKKSVRLGGGCKGRLEDTEFFVSF